MSDTKNPFDSFDEPETNAFDQFDAPAAPAGLGRKAADLGLSVAKGVVAVPEAVVGIADLVTGGKAGKAVEDLGVRFKDTKQILTDLQSDDLKGKQRQFQEADGILDKAGVALSNPSLIANTVAESAPLMGAGGVIGRVALPALGARMGAPAAAAAAGAIGEGAVGAGSAAEAIRQETLDGELTAGQAALAAGSGAATGVIGAAGGALARRMGLGDIDTMAVTGTTAAPIRAGAKPKGMLRRTAEGAVVEGAFEEVPQSLSEQGFQNAALDRPLTEGMVDAGVMGGLAGGVMGGVAGAISRPAAPPPPPPGPLTGAVALLPAPVVTVDSEGRAKMDGVPSGGFDNGQQQGVRTEPQEPAMRALPPPTVNVDSQGTARAPGQNMPPPRPAGPLETGAAMAQGRNSEPVGAPALPAPAIDVDAQGRAITPDQRQDGRAAQSSELEAEQTRRQSLGLPQMQRDGDVLAEDGKPFRNGVAAARAAKRAGPGFQAVRVNDREFVVRRGEDDVTDVVPREPSRTIDEGARQAAVSPHNDLPEPTPRQILGGNARLGHAKIGRLGISIENDSGSTRQDKNNTPPKWTTPMQWGYHYGYFKRSEAADSNEAKRQGVDGFFKEGLDESYSGPVFIVDQLDPKTGKFDEHKVMVGPASEIEASNVYRKHYEPGWKGLGAITRMEWADFEKWVRSGKKELPAVIDPTIPAAAVDSGAAPDSAPQPADAPAAGQPGAPAPAPAPAAAVGAPAPLRMGKTPTNAEPVTVADDGTVMIGKYPAVDFDSGEPIVLNKNQRNTAQIRHALHNAGAVPSGSKFFGGAVADAAAAKDNAPVGPAPTPDTPPAAKGDQGTGGSPAPAATAVETPATGAIDPQAEYAAVIDDLPDGQIELLFKKAKRPAKLKPAADVAAMRAQLRDAPEATVFPIYEELADAPDFIYADPAAEASRFDPADPEDAEFWDNYEVSVFPDPPETVDAVKAAGKTYISMIEAKRLLAEWKAEAKRQGKEEDHSNEVVISLYDASGIISKPWDDAGYDVRRYDIELGDDLMKFFPLGELMALKAEGKKIKAILAQPPCTTFTSTGSQWHATHHDADDKKRLTQMFGPAATEWFSKPNEYGKALVALTDTLIGELQPEVFVMENPNGGGGPTRITKEVKGLPKALLKIQPNLYGDPYTKLTLLWGKFNPELPTANVEPTQGSLMHKLWSSAEKNGGKRSQTPEGFAYAFFMANSKPAKVAAEPVSAKQRWNDGSPVVRRQMLAEIERPELANSHLGITWDSLSTNLQASFRAKTGEPAPKAERKPVTPQVGRGPSAEEMNAAREKLPAGYTVNWDRAGGSVDANAFTVKRPDGTTVVSGLNGTQSGLNEAVRQAGLDAEKVAPAAKTDKAEIRPYRKPDGSVGYEAVPIAAPAAPKPAKPENSWVATGRTDFAAGKPRELPSYFTDKTGPNAKAWLRGWDESKAEAPAADAPRQFAVGDRVELTETGATATVAKRVDMGKGQFGYFVQEDGKPDGQMSTATPEAMKPTTKAAPAAAPTVAERKNEAKEKKSAARRQLETLAEQATAAGADKLAERMLFLSQANGGGKGGTGNGKSLAQGPGIAPAHAKAIADRFPGYLERAKQDPADDFRDVTLTTVGQSDAERAAKAKMLGAAAKLAELLSKNTRSNITPEQEQKMLPIVIELFEGAMELGYVKFKQAARFVRDYVAQMVDQEAADAIPVDTLQGAYIATARRHADKDVTPKGEVVTTELADILAEKPAPSDTDGVENSADQADTGATDDSSPAIEPPADDRELAPLEPRPGSGDAAVRRGAAAQDASDGRADDGGVRQPDRRDQGPDDVPQGLGDGGSDSGVPDGRTGSVERSGERELAGDYRAPDGSLTRSGSWFSTAKRNVDLIELALSIEAEKRAATPAEQELLAKYVGFGASEIRNALFPVPGQWARSQEPDRLIWPDLVEARWKPLAERLDKLPREWQKSVLQSTQYAHYTSEGIVRGVWAAVQRMGFTGGKTLEPGAGIGNFVMAMPESMRRPKGYTGIEMDGPTALIARLLSPGQNMLHEDFIKRKLPRDFFDLAIGNPPFSQTKILGDPDYEKHGFMLHDFFFAKSIDRVRPGGLLVFVTSKGTMDKQTDKARKYLADRADLLGAIRLPSTAFEANAGTSVVADVIFLRKREAGAEPAGQPWTGVATVETPDGPVVVNEYFAAHPEMVLGQQRISGGQDDEGRRINSNGRGGEKYTVVSYDKTPAELDAKFAAAVQKLPENVYSTLRASAARAKEETRRVDYNPAVKREGVVYLDGKQLMRVESGLGKEMLLSAKDAEWFRGYVALRDLVQTARKVQAEDGDWEASLKALNKGYDAFVKKHGPINDYRTITRKSTDEDGEPVETTIRVFKNNRLLRQDYDQALMISLERIDEAGKIHKSAFLQGRTIGKPVTREVKTVGDALAVSLDELGRLDLADVGQRLHISPDEAIEALGTNVYKTPGGVWQLSDEYLSGDVVAKLEEAETAARIDPSLERNVEALKAVQPDRLGPSQISVKLGASWVSAEYVNEFAKEIGAGAVTFDSKTESWQVQGGNERSARRAGAEYGTAARSPSELLEAALNSRQVTVKVTVDKKEVTDAESTTAANEMLRKIKDKFKSWIWTDTERAATLVEAYNRRFNNIAPRRFDRSHLTLPGVSLRFKLHPHQLRAIWRQIQTGNTYLAHAVGAGKTIEMIAGGMEQKRLGLIKKPVYVVPNHMLEQFSNEFMELYPLANIMVADDENFSAERRKQFVAAATLNAPDAIVITQSAFERVGVTEASVAPIRDEILDDLQAELDDVEKGDRVRRSQLQQQIEAVEQRFDSIVGMGKKDNVIPFEEMGIDYIYADEAHAFRKLDFSTNQKIKGIDPQGSRRSLDMYVKTRILERRRPGRAFTFASGTPVTNTMGELYTLMRYFVPDEMARTRITSFDSWARQFGEVGVALEANAAGRYENVTRFSKFDNVPELMSRVRTFMDVLTSEHLGALVKRPDIEGGKPNLVLVEATKALKAFMKNVLSPRLEKSRAWKPSKDEPFNPDPVIAIISDGRFAALDPRFFGGKPEKDEASKLDEMAGRIVKTYAATADNVYVDRDTGKPEALKGSTQIVFYNLGFGAASMANRGFDARAHLTKQLTAGGVKREHILWFDDANTDAKKEAMFQAMRSGKARILIGSAKKMGTGVNVQKRLIRLHYFDPPWYPSDVEQPHGRIIRQGNQNDLVGIDWYATKGAYDSTMWQMVGRKQRFIDQAFSGDKSLRSMEDMSEASQYEQAAAMASGDPRALQLAGYRQDVERLERLQAAHANEQINVRSGLSSARWQIDSAEKRIADLDKALAVLGGNYFTWSTGKVGPRAFDKQGEFGQAVKDAFNGVVKGAIGDEKRSERPVALGSLGPVKLMGYPFWRAGRKDGEESTFAGVGLVAVVGDEKIDVLHADAMGDTVDAVGLARKIINAVNGLSSERDRRQRELTANTEDEKRLNRKLGVPFEHQQEMLEKYAALKQLEAELRAEGEADAKAAAAANKPPVVVNPDGSDGTPPADGDAPAFSRSIFRSALRDAIDGAKQENAPGVGWLNFIAGLTQKGVKPAEIEWSGVRDWLGMQTGRISKAQVLAFLDDNGVKVTETVKGEKGSGLDSTEQQLRERRDSLNVKLTALGYDLRDEYGEPILTRRDDQATFLWGEDGWTDDDGEVADLPVEVRDTAMQLGHAIDELESLGGRVDPDDTRYAKYTLPGGENYREILLTLPSREKRTTKELLGPQERLTVAEAEKAFGFTDDGDAFDHVLAYPEAGYAHIGVLKNGRFDVQIYSDEREFKRLEDAEAFLLDRFVKREGMVKTPDFLSSHWAQPNILAHIRVNDRVDADGKKVLFVEEIQSDWAQKGRKSGFMPKDPKNPTDDEVRAYFGLKEGTNPTDYREEMVADLSGDRTVHRISRANKDSLLPRAPFVENTDSWLQLALKRILQQAADGGYDRVAFVTGKQSADRYSLTHVVSKLSWLEPGEQYGGAGRRSVMLDLIDGRSAAVQVNADGIVSSGTRELRADGKRLEDLVGKGVAEKIMGSPKGELAGLELNIGGEGMVAFYDKVIPQTLNKLLPKLGGGKVAPMELRHGGWQVRSGGRTVNVGSGREAAEDVNRMEFGGRGEVRQEASLTQPGFDVTDAMREQVAKGLPMFGRGAAPAPSTLNPTEIQQAVSKLTGSWLRKPDIHVLDSMDDAPPWVREIWQRQNSAGGTGAIEGFHFRGGVYLVADALESAADVQRVLYHEALGHFGLRGVFGDGLKPILQQLATMRPQLIAKKAQQYGLDLSKESERLLAAEEVLAELAQTRPELGWVQRAIAVIRRALRAVGLVKNLTDNDVIANYILPARGFVERARSQEPSFAAEDPDEPDPGSGGEAPAFSRATIVGATRTYTTAQQRGMRNVGFEVQEPTLKERAQAVWKDAGKKLAQGIADQFAPVKDLDDAAYRLLRLSKGASGAFETLLHGGQLKLSDQVYDFDEAKRGGVLDKLLMPLQGEHHDFFRWIAANRAERLAGEGKENLFTPQDIADLKTLADGQLQADYKIQNGPRAGQVTRDRRVAYQDSLTTFNAFNKNVLDMAEQSGLIDGASRHLWEHEFYVPFYRVADAQDGGISGANIKTGVIRQKAFEKLKGGKNKLNADLLDNTLHNWAHLLDASAKNRGARATLEAAERLGAAIGADERTAREIGKATGNKQGVVWFMDGGRERYFVVEDPYLLAALTSLEYAGMRNPVMDAMGAFKHALTVGVTASPFFKIRNLIRDSVQVLATSKINPNPGSNLAEGWAVVKDGIRDASKSSDDYFRLLAGGGTIHFGTMLEGSEAKRVQALVESGVDSATILNSADKLKAFYRKVVEPTITAYNELGNRGEAINRAALYKQLRRQGLTHAEASLQARDLMDFSMQGSFTTIRFLTQVVPFFNARIQGMYKLGRAAKEDPARFAAVVGAVSAISVGLLLAQGDDDDWKKREEWDRNNYWWVKVGGTAYRIPKPFEIGAMATLAERSFELAFDKEMTGTRFRKQVMELLGDNLSMNPIPQLIKPIVGVYSNKDGFTGRPIETMDMERLLPEYRFTDRTTMFARGASTAMNAATGVIGVKAPSPVQIDHMLRGYFGWLGAFVVGAGDLIARPATGQPTHPRPDYWRTATGGIVSEIEGSPSRYVSQMYEQAKEIEQAYGTWRMLVRSGKAEEAAAFRADNQEDLAKFKNIERVKRGEGVLNQRIRAIERSDLAPELKAERIKVIRDQQDRLARQVN